MKLKMIRIGLFIIAILLYSCSNKKDMKSNGSEVKGEVIPLNNSSDSTLHSFFHENGELKMQEVRVNDTLEGTTKVYYKNGQLNKTIQFKNGKAHGITKVFDEDGFLRKEYLYLQDSQIVANVRSYTNSTIKNLHFNVDNKRSFLIDSINVKRNNQNYSNIIRQFKVSHKDTIFYGDTLEVTVTSDVATDEFIQLIIGEFNSDFKPFSEDNLLNSRSYKGKVFFTTRYYDIGDNLLVGWFIKGNKNLSTSHALRRIFYTTYHVVPRDRPNTQANK